MVVDTHSYIDRHTYTVESRFGPKLGFGVTPGELLTISKPNPYTKSEKTPSAERVHKTKSLKSPR